LRFKDLLGPVTRVKKKKKKKKKHLPSEKPQRAAVRARIGLRKPLQRLVRLAWREV